MRNLVIMPAMAQNRERMNLGEYAEEATIIMDEPVKPANHFIEANTQEVTLNHLKNDCITPVFSKTYNQSCTVRGNYTGCSTIFL